MWGSIKNIAKTGNLILQASRYRHALLTLLSFHFGFPLSLILCVGVHVQCTYLMMKLLQNAEFYGHSFFIKLISACNICPQ